MAWKLVSAMSAVSVVSFASLRFVIAGLCGVSSVWAASNVALADVPDYAWHAGCFGTATGNLIGYWDRHGFPNMYTGPTGGGMAPLSSFGANVGIRSLWASQAGLDGRPANQPGHIDEYWLFGGQSFESTAPDPYTTAGRAEHEPDCLGDFMGQSQRKYSDLNGECTGNIDGFAFTYWDKNGDRLVNFEPPMVDGVRARDIPSGLREFTKYRGYAADATSQLVDFNPTVPAGKGFTFEELKAEIDAGYPVVLILQNYNELSRALPGLPNANPHVHAMVAYGYVETDEGARLVRYKTSWASGDLVFSHWNSDIWQAALPLRGVITYRPQPRITKVERSGSEVRMEWHGPSSVLVDSIAGTSTPVHRYVIERGESVTGPFVAVTEPRTELEASFADSHSGEQVFFRVRLAAE